MEGLLSLGSRVRILLGAQSPNECLDEASLDRALAGVCLAGAHVKIAGTIYLINCLRACQTITDFCVLGAAGWIV